jgi:hypothetical protein
MISGQPSGIRVAALLEKLKLADSNFAPADFSDDPAAGGEIKICHCLQLYFAFLCAMNNLGGERMFTVLFDRCGNWHDDNCQADHPRLAAVSITSSQVVTLN